MKQKLILTPLSIELKALLERMKQLGHSASELTVGSLKIHQFPQLGLNFALGGHGKTQFGIQTQYWIHQLPNIDAVICAGCAGSLSENVKPQDVVIATKTIEHDFQLKFIKRADPAFSANPELLEKVKQLKDFNFPIQFGPVASGDEDILDAARAAELKTQTDALAVAWEGAGGARACQFNQKAFLEIRGITDSANKEATSEFSSNLPIAMSNVCDVILAAFSAEI